MTRPSAAENYLIDQIRAGDADAWRQLVERYQGRLVAFASRDLRSAADAEDVVQETFVSLLKGLARFRAESSLETYLFVILRRRMTDFYRRQPAHDRDSSSNEIASDTDTSPDQIRAPEMTASWYVRQAEARGQQFECLGKAIQRLGADLRQELKFDDLLLIELLFGRQWRNKEIAAEMGVDEKWIALRKHRFNRRLSSYVHGRGKRADFLDPATDLDSMLTEIWAELRPTCPKRSTIGRYLLGTLDTAWTEYVRRHVHVVACRFCCANLEDIQAESLQRESVDTTSRIMRSTIGFFDPPSS